MYFIDLEMQSICESLKGISLSGLSTAQDQFAVSLSQAVGVGNKKEDELKHSKLNKVRWFNTVVLTVGSLLAICSEILARFTVDWV